MTEEVRKRIITGVRLALTVGLLIYLVLYVDPRAVLDTIAGANPAYLGIALLLSFVNLFFQYRKWALICSYQFGETRRQTVLSSLFFGISGGMLTPMKTGEFVARSLPLKGVRLMEVFFATFLDKIIPMLVAIEVGSVLMCFHLVLKVGLPAWAVALTFVGLSVVTVSVLILTLKTRSSISRFLMRSRFLQGVHRQLKIIKNYDPRLILSLTGLAALLHLTFTSQFAFLILAFDAGSSFWSNLFLTNLVIFIQIAIPPLLVGELGVREGAAVYLSRFYSIVPVAAFNAAFLLFTMNFILPSLYGLFFVMRRSRE